MRVGQIPYQRRRQNTPPCFLVTQTSLHWGNNICVHLSVCLTLVGRYSKKDMSQRRAANAKQAPVVAEATVVKGPLSLDTTKPNLSEEQVPLSTGSDLSSNNNNNSESPSARVLKWKESPFAVGLTEPTWEAERLGLSTRGRKNDDLPILDDEYLPKDTTGCLCCSAVVCSFLGAGRVGNMVVLSSTTEWVEHVEQDLETGEEKVTRYTRPKLNWVVGPL